MQMMPAPVISDFATAEEAAVQPAGSCAHCMERSDVPAMTVARQVNQLKRNVDEAATHTPTPLAPSAALFAPPVLSRQGSPPGAQPRKHLLISLFLI